MMISFPEIIIIPWAEAQLRLGLGLRLRLRLGLRLGPGL